MVAPQLRVTGPNQSIHSVAEPSIGKAYMSAVNFIVHFVRLFGNTSKKCPMTSMETSRCNCTPGDVLRCSKRQGSNAVQVIIECIVNGGPGIYS